MYGDMYGFCRTSCVQVQFLQLSGRERDSTDLFDQNLSQHNTTQISLKNNNNNGRRRSSACRHRDVGCSTTGSTTADGDREYSGNP
ncbi:hypothetical protein P8452_36702 [Trifolium repens]|nr:hypothetical protein P8452_36702 [Trifolium repens]